MKDTPDKSDISLILVKNEKDIATFHLDEMSQQLWGHPVPRQYPIYLVFHHGKPVGTFWPVSKLSFIQPSTLNLTPKSSSKINRSLINEMKRFAGKQLYALRSTKSGRQNHARFSAEKGS
jgi:hypothetical protein